ncbi:guanine-N(7)-methyltransferase domain-containing protein [Globomyces pollinis-pini]|nr:guanine-N(7)-methyltransferase domain-containing protein [Globomyces pollinis-pini]
MQNSSVVANHYNNRPDVGVKHRQLSPIFHMKNFNNWTKSMLINQFTHPNYTVLDLCCGKGGDLLKWKQCNISHLLGLDIASVSIEQAKKRYNDGRFRFKAHYKAVDCFSDQLTSACQGWIFDVVSVQFAFHYCFENEAKVRSALQSIANVLKTGGVYFGTIPNSALIVKKLLALNGDDRKFGNSIYSIEFEQKSSFPIFGHKYWFRLEDAIDDCPEYLIHFPTLQKIAAEYGLECILHRTFHDYFNDNYEKGMYLLERMKVFDSAGNISFDEWEASGLYSVFAFRKV